MITKGLAVTTSAKFFHELVSIGLGWRCRLSLTGVVLVASLIAVPVDAQLAKLPDTFDELVALKNEELEQYSALSEAGKADEAIATLRTIVSIHRKIMNLAVADGTNQELIDQQQNLFSDDGEYFAGQLFDRGEFAEAADIREEIEQLYERVLGADANATRDMHWKALATRKVSEATPSQQAAFVEATATIARANAAMNEGRFEVAARLYEQAVRVRSSVLGEQHPNVAEDLHAYARSLWIVERYDEAETTYKKSIAIREATLGKGLLSAGTHFNLGAMYQDQGRYAEAEAELLIAAAIEEPILGSSNESFLQTLGKLASVYEASGDATKLAEVQARIAAADPLATVLRHLPGGTFSAGAVEPSTWTSEPRLNAIPYELIEAYSVENLGINPLNIDALVAFATLPIGSPDFNGGVLLKFNSNETTESLTTMVNSISAAAYKAGLDVDGTSNQPYFVEFEDGTLAIGNYEAVRQCVEDAGDTLVGEYLVADRGRGQIITAANVEMVRAILSLALQDAPPMPEGLAGLKQLPETVDVARAHVNLADGLDFSVLLESIDEATAQKTAEIVTNALNFGVQSAQAAAEEQFAGDTATDDAMRRYSVRMARMILGQLEPTVEENIVSINFDVIDNAFVPSTIALLLPAVQAARAAAKRSMDRNKLLQIGLAMFNYESIYASLPAQSNFDDDGKPRLSWRVMILPLLEEHELYEQFHLDEPWDSEHNLKLVDFMPDIYRSENLDDDTRTPFVGITGPGTFLDGTKGIRFRDFIDGTANTMIVVEAAPENAVIWTKPADLTIDADNPRNGLSDARDGGFFALFADGSVSTIGDDVDGESIQAMSTRNGGEIVNRFD